jgi:hypothetical protein
MAEVGAVVFALAVALSVGFRGRLFPFSELSMFASSYTPTTLITLRSPDGATVHSSKRYLGCSTSGLSREFAAAGSAPEFLESVGRRAARPLPADAVWWRERIVVDASGGVTREGAVLGPVMPPR